MIKNQGHQDNQGNHGSDNGKGEAGMSEWKECKLGDIATLNYGKALKENVRVCGNIPVFSSAGISGWHNSALVDSKGIIIGRKGTIGKVYKTEVPFFCIDTAYYVLPNENIYDFTYIYYALQTLGLEELNSDSAVPGLNREAAYNQELLLPPLPEQKTIASVLSSLDDKIDLLHRQNKTLEAMADALFRQWFVEEAEEGWKTVKIGDFAETNVYSVDKSFDIKKIRYLDTGSLTEGKIEGYQIIDFADAPSRARRIVKHNDILISTVRPNQKHYGIIKKPDNDIIVSTGFCVITCKNINPHFIYIYLTTNEMTEYLHTIAEGSTSAYPSLKPSDIENLEFQVPPKNKLHEFSEYADDAWEKIDYNHKQIQTLEKLRDTLLPKLISGEVRVSV